MTDERLEALAQRIRDVTGLIAAAEAALVEAGGGFNTAIDRARLIFQREGLIEAWGLVTGNPWAEPDPEPYQPRTVPIADGVVLAYQDSRGWRGPRNAKWHTVGCRYLRTEGSDGAEGPWCHVVGAVPEVLLRKAKPQQCGTCAATP